MERIIQASLHNPSVWEAHWGDSIGGAFHPPTSEETDHAGRPNTHAPTCDGDTTHLLESVLNTLPDAVMAVDCARTVHWANRAARAWLARPESGVMLVANRLRGATLEADRALQACVAAPADLQRTVLPAALGGTPVTVTTRHLCKVGPPFAAFTEGQQARQSLPQDKPSLLLTLSPGGMPVPTQRAVLRAAFGFTPAEAHLATAMLAGHSLADCAKERNVAICTVRTQLANLYSKTGTRRQSELVALLAKVN